MNPSLYPWVLGRLRRTRSFSQEVVDDPGCFWVYFARPVLALRCRVEGGLVPVRVSGHVRGILGGGDELDSWVGGRVPLGDCPIPALFMVDCFGGRFCVVFVVGISSLW